MVGLLDFALDLDEVLGCAMLRKPARGRDAGQNLVPPSSYYAGRDRAMRVGIAKQSCEQAQLAGC